jgi:chorismate mutase-like protein
LFEYYSYRPAQLLRWHPGAGVILEGPGAAEYLAFKGYVRCGDGVGADGLPAEREAAVGWIRDLLAGTALRAGQFGCFGLHEWAMVYRAREVRHPTWPLRLAAGDLEAFVESQALRCSHFDAFRFFTPEAKPLNRLQPTRESALDLEQPACLHANMDLYKWAYKLTPWTPSELTADAFELAREIRVCDMRASPYDLSALGHEPIRIETEDGRREYERMQRDLADRAAPLRRRLISLCDRLLEPLRETRAVIAALGVVLFFSLPGCATTPPPLPEDAEPVVEWMARRLALAHDVAWAKWATGLPVRDPERERAVVERAVLQAEAAGLDPVAVSRFIAAQIEASCIQQEFWMSKWRSGSGLPPGDPPTVDSLRTRIDLATSRLVAEWAAAGPLTIARGSVVSKLVAEGFSPAAAKVAGTGIGR